LFAIFYIEVGVKKVFGWARAIVLFAQYKIFEENKNAKNKK
jgi:hypothetical protein